MEVSKLHSFIKLENFHLTPPQLKEMERKDSKNVLEFLNKNSYQEKSMKKPEKKQICEKINQFNSLIFLLKFCCCCQHSIIAEDRLV